MVGDPADAIPCCWLFVPLPQHLPVPHGWSIGERQDPGTTMSAAVGGRLTSGLRTSMSILQVPRSAELLTRDILDITVGAVREKVDDWAADSGRPSGEANKWPWENFEGLSESVLGASPTMTIVEVAFPESQAAIGELLDEAIERARWLQQGVAILTQGPLRLVTRRQLPPVLPVLMGHLHADGRKPTYDEARVVVVDRSAPPSSYAMPNEELDSEQIDRLSDVISAVVEERAFMLFGDLRREAFVQHHVDGNNRLAVATYATAGEVLITTLILHMTWEDGVDPYDAAQRLDLQEGHARQIDLHVVGRLGGPWSRQGNGVVAAYFRNLVHLRHRVVHAGHAPADHEVDLAARSLVEFERFIGDRLCDQRNLNRCTRTAMAFVGNSGILRRGRWTKAVEAITSDPTQPNWAQSFLRWRAHFDQALAEPASGRPGDLAELQLFAEVDRGTVTHVLWDPVRRTAVEVDAASFMPPEPLENLAALIESERASAPFRVRLLDPQGRCPVRDGDPTTSSSVTSPSRLARPEAS